MEVLAFIETFQIGVLQLAEEEDGELVLPLLNEHFEAIEVLAAASLRFQSVLLLFLVFFIGLHKIAQVFRSFLHLEFGVSVALDFLELFGGIGLHRAFSGRFFGCF